MAYSPLNSFGSWRNNKRKLPSSLGTPHRVTPIRSPVLDLHSPGAYSTPVIPGINASMRTYRSRTPVTVAQKTAPMFAHFGKIGVVRRNDIS